MAITQITTGEQSVTETGAVTGTANTSSLASPFTLFVRVRGLAAGDTIKLSIQDTENSSEFSDALDVALVDINGGMPNEGVTYSFPWYEMPSMRYGAEYCELRLNCLAISGGTAICMAWIDSF